MGCTMPKKNISTRLEKIIERGEKRLDNYKPNKYSKKPDHMDEMRLQLPN